MITACLLGHLLRTGVLRAPAAAHLPLPVTGNRPLSHHLVSLGRCTAPPIVYTRPQRKEFNFLYHMGPEGVRNRKKHPSFLLMPNFHENVSLNRAFFSLSVQALPVPETIWHQQKRWVFFSITDPFRTHV